MISYTDQYVLLAITSSFLFGYHIAVLNTSINVWIGYFGVCSDSGLLTCSAAKNYLSIMGSSLFLTAAVAASLASLVLNRGRRFTLIVTHMVSLVATAVCVCAFHPVMFVIGRFIAGFTVGLSTVIPPTIISEMASPKIRGSRNVCHQSTIAIGIILAIALGKGLNSPPTDAPLDYVVSGFDIFYARLMQAFPGLISLASLVIMFVKLKDDTPQALWSQNKLSEAKFVLCKIYGNEGQADNALNILQTGSDNTSSDISGYKKIFSRSDRLRVFLIGVFLAAAQQLGGINVFISMSNNIFLEAGLSTSAATNFSIGMSLANGLMTIPTALLIDKWGRKPLLSLGFLGQAFALMLYPTGALFSRDPEMVAKLSVVSIILYILFFAMSAGPVLWVYLFEMFPNDIKDVSATTACAVNWLTGFMIVTVSSYFTSRSQIPYLFLFFAVVCFGTCIVISTYLLETKGAKISPYDMRLPDISEKQPLVDSA